MGDKKDVWQGTLPSWSLKRSSSSVHSTVTASLGRIEQTSGDLLASTTDPLPRPASKLNRKAQHLCRMGRLGQQSQSQILQTHSRRPPPLEKETREWQETTAILTRFLNSKNRPHEAMARRLHSFLNLFRKRTLGPRARHRNLPIHLEMHIADSISAWANRSSETRPRQTKETYATPTSSRCCKGTVTDFTFALRSLARKRSFFVAIFTSALVSGTTVMISMVYDVFLTPCLINTSNRYVALEFRTSPMLVLESALFSAVDEIRAFRQENHVFDDAIFRNGLPPHLRPMADPSHHWRRGDEAPPTPSISWESFQMLGRTFPPTTAARRSSCLLMNYRLWKKESLASERPDSVSFSMEAANARRNHPQRFNFFGASFWLTMSDAALTFSVGRLKPGVTLQAASSDLDAIAHRRKSRAHRAVSGHFSDPFLNVSGQFRRRLQENNLALLAAYCCFSYRLHQRRVPLYCCRATALDGKIRHARRR